MVRTARSSSAIGVFAWMTLGLMVLACTPPQPSWNGEIVEPPLSGLALSGVNWDGEPFELSDVEDQVTMVFFGYTFCPDVCPFTLVKMKQIYNQLGDRANEVAMVFVSVDPQRDTLDKLANYVPNFDERFYGLRLEADEIDLVDEAFGLTVQYGQPKDGAGTDSFYYVDHTGTYFVFDRGGRLRLKFPPNAEVAQILPDLEVLLAG